MKRPPGRLLRSLQIATTLATLGICAGAALAARLYLSEYPQGFALAALGILAFFLTAGIWMLPRIAGGGLAAVSFLAAFLLLEVGLPASAFWPGGITASRFGLTVVGACPVPIFDLTISAVGAVGFRDKTHRVAASEVFPLLSEDVEAIIIATGWNGEMRVDDDVRAIPGLRIEILKTPAAFELYNRLRREGRRVALLAHTTC